MALIVYTSSHLGHSFGLRSRLTCCLQVPKTILNHKNQSVFKLSVKFINYPDISGPTKNVLSVSLNELVHTVMPVDLHQATEPAHFWISHHLIRQHNKHVGNRFLVAVLNLNALFRSVDLRDVSLSLSLIRSS